MYVIALLSLVKLYQKRHPDVASSAYKVFLGVGAVLLMEVLGIFTGNAAYWVIAVMIYSAAMLILSVVLYHNGKWPINAGGILRIFGLVASFFETRGGSVRHYFCAFCMYFILSLNRRPLAL